MKILIFDHIMSGHHGEYISHLLKFLPNDFKKVRFLVREEIKDHELVELSISELKDNGTCEIDYLTKDDLLYLNGGMKIFRPFRVLNFISKYCNKHNFDKLFFLYLNSVFIALMIKRPPLDIYGILFLQFTRISADNFRTRLKKLAKGVITRLVTYNKNVIKIFLINDEWSANYLNEKYNLNKYEFLLDPLPEIPNIGRDKSSDILKKLKLNENKFFLHPGSITDRKGTIELIMAFNKSKNKSNYKLLIIGKASKEFETKLRAIIKDTDMQDSVIFRNDFVSYEVLNMLIKLCKAVIIPYKISETSSGIIGHTMKNNKLLITVNRGLIGELARNYSKSILIKSCTVIDIKRAIEKIDLNTITNCNNTNNKFSAKEFTYKIVKTIRS